jgi:rRNA maturation RNase YbeY
MPVRIFKEGVSFRLTNFSAIQNWIKFSTKSEGFSMGEVSFIFCTDSFLLKMNKQYLKHNTLTDIITFDYSEGGVISGDIFISLDRVFENASKFKVSNRDELLRVMIHGVLHLIGYSDKSKSQKSKMREKEDAYLSLWHKKFHVKQRH